MKNLIKFLIFIGIILGVYYNKDKIILEIMDKIVYNKKIYTNAKNNYYVERNIDYAKTTDKVIPENKQEIINIFYTALNSGWNEFSFYCPDKYKNCKEDVNKIVNDEEILPTLNNYVHPYNSYEKFSISINNFGKVSVIIDKIYSKEDILLINQKVDEIIKNNIDMTMSEEEKLKTIHDLIINTTKYDEAKENIEYDGIKKYILKSNLAYGPLINGYGICGGYSDAYSIILFKLGIDNFKISTNNHVWNVVRYKDNWKHVDLTWDDPVTNTKEDVITDNYFLINNAQLYSQDTTEHTFKTTLYPIID